MTQLYPAPIINVISRSTAARAGVRAGDVLLALNEMPLRDVIDVQVYAAEPELTVLIERDGCSLTLEIQRRYGEPLGLEFAEPLFDGHLRRCRNACDFCFVTQMAPGLRDSLYVKDDDYRLSFLNGNYITLTNLDEDDWERIETQFLSPLYVSVHATEPEIRAGLMRNPRAGQIMTHLTQLADIGIEVHTQAVLVPGRNDGMHLDRTVTDLVALYPQIVDLTVVPVGLTRWHSSSLRPYTGEETAVVLDQVLAWQARLRDELGRNFVYPSDEWFLRAGVPIPSLEAYDDLLPALIENGVGMVRLFEEAWEELLPILSQLGQSRQVWVTGTLFAPTLREYAALFTAATGRGVDVLPVPNHILGETVTVAGLLTVADILAALPQMQAGDVMILPGEIFRGPDGAALDGKQLSTLTESTGCQSYVLDRQMTQWTVTQGA
ncbi:MAG: DUF512 domain-containing protein [Anaerolineae bacterium]|nr:DUF512 domain-containing protein [Anaerolineae bacterium]